MSTTDNTFKRKIEVVPYDHRWPDYFRQEADRIKVELGPQVLAIHHIGSTSIPAMPAKPVIDIIMECENLDEIQIIDKKLTTIGFHPVSRQIIPHRSFITHRESENIRIHLHIYERGSSQIKRHVNFRDYVIAHPKEARLYAELKVNLAKTCHDDMKLYVCGKDKLVQQIDASAKLWPGRKMDYLTSNTGPSASHWTKDKIIKAMETNMNVHMTHFAQFLDQVELIRIPGYTLVNAGLNDDTFNYVLDADFTAENAEMKIAEVNQYFVDRKSPYSWWVSPNDKPDNLTECLENSEFLNTENNTAMFFNLDNWQANSSPPSPVKIIRATTEQALQDFALVLTNDEPAFRKYYSWIASTITEEDPIEYYVGYVNDKPVVRGLTCYEAQVAGFYWLSTAPDERQKGYASAMHHYRLNRAKELGYHIAILQASSEATSLNRKLGYQECGFFKEYKLKD